jgi:hypothetical protein
MMTKLDKDLKRQISVGGHSYVVTISPNGLKLTLKGRRKGRELAWTDLVGDDATLAIALNASLGRPVHPLHRSGQSSH